MNLETYRNFVKIIDAGTISAAARELCIAQPALSQQLKTVEAAYGTALVKRSARHISLTSAGHILYERAKRMCLMEQAAQEEIHACIAGTRGTLHLGLTPSWPDSELADMLMTFGKAYPHIDFDICEENSDQLLTLLDQERIEVAIIRRAAPLPPRFTAPHLVDERLMIAFHRDLPGLSAKAGALPVTALEDIPLAISRGFQQKIREICQSAGFTPRIRLTAASRYLPLRWALSGTAAAIFVGTARPDQLAEEICCCPLIGPGLETRRMVTVLRDRAMSAVTRVFLQYLQEQLPHVKE